MKTLQKLGIKRNWLYEIVISSYTNNTPHAAPFGIRSSDFKYITMEMYKGSDTLENILTNKEFVINLVDGPALLYQALYARQTINFGIAEKIKAPVISDSPSNIEVKLINAVNKKQSVLIKAQVVHIHAHKKTKLINRAENLFLESLILSTRATLFPKLNLEKSMRENYRVIKKVAPGSKYEIMMKDLLNHCG